MKIIGLIISLSVCYISFAQNVIINGKAETYTGKEIGIFTYDDLLTNREVQHSSVIVNDKGEFALKLNVSETQRIFLKIEKQRSFLFVEPGKTYEVMVPPPDSAVFVGPNMPSEVGLFFQGQDSLELNNLIMDFNERVGDFWYKNYKLFVVNRARAKLDSFSRATIQHYAPVKNDYFKKHVEYSLASLDYGISQAQKTPEATYFSGKPILYYNYEYMQLLNSIFKQYLQKLAFSKNGMGLVDQINGKASYEGAMKELLTINPALRSDSLRELVLLKGLPDLYYAPEFTRQNVLSILDQVEAKTIISEHKKIASNIRKSFSKLEKGQKAPEFNLPDKNGKMQGLEDYKGKYIYLDFWATWCGPCLKEMKVIPSLKKKYGDKIVFVSISTDENIDAMKNFLVKNPKYDWVFLHSGKGKLKEEYSIKSVPTYFLIDPSGNFIQSPAEKPSEGIEDTFYKLTKPKEKKFKVGEK